VRKWTTPDPDVALPPRPDRVEGEKVERARAFRRWIAAGAEPGGLRALAGERSRDTQTRDERPTGAPR
jgi:hypothetical protein